MTFDISKAIKDGGSFDIIRRRLIKAAEELQTKTDKVNSLRSTEFGGGELELSGNINLLTENNCIPVDMARVGNQLLFGFSTKLGIKSHLEVEDLLSVYQLHEDNSEPELVDLKNTFVYDKQFFTDLSRLLKYNKSVELKQLYRKGEELFIVFSTSERGSDYQHFRFNLTNPSSPKYLGNLGGRPKSNHSEVNWSRLTDSNIVGSTQPLYSVKDSIFLGVKQGALKLKVDDNSKAGRTLLTEPLENTFQRTQDIIVHFFSEGNLTFLKVKVLDESEERFYVFNTITEKLVRADGIKNGVQSLPENHGVIFSNGYALSSGEVKTFNTESHNLEFHKMMSSPNGEDTLYFYSDIANGQYTIYHYNMINKSVASPMHACGYALKENGELFMFRSSQNNQAEKLHKLQIWSTPFMTQTYYAESQNSSTEESTIKNIGNASLVRGISDVMSILKLVRDDDISASLYEGIIKSSINAIDAHFWFDSEELFSLKTDLILIKETSETVLEEFNKTSQLAQQAHLRQEELRGKCENLVHDVNVLRGSDTHRYISLLQEAKALLGELTVSKDARFVDATLIDALIQKTDEQKSIVVDGLVSLLQKESSFEQFHSSINSIEKAILSANKSAEINPQKEKIEELTGGLTSLNDEVSEITVEDTTKITFIIEQLSQCFTSLNTLRSVASSKLEDFARSEAEKEFAAQLKQLDQMIEVAMSRVNTPSECDNELAKLTSQFEKLEGRFSDFDDYIEKITSKRNDTYSNIEGRKTQLVSEIQRRISNIQKSASVSLNNIRQRCSRLSSITELHSLLSSDPMVNKVREYAAQIENLGDAVISSGILNELNSIKEESSRDIRDSQDLFEDNGKVVVLGKHRFSVNKKELALNIIEKDGKPHATISSTDFNHPIEDPKLNNLVEYFDYDVPSENSSTYRAEYLAFQILGEISNSTSGFSHDEIKLHIKNKSMSISTSFPKLVSEYISKSYKEGYIRGVHDIDGLAILEKVYPLYFNDNGISQTSQSDRIDGMNLFNELREKGELSTLYKHLNDMKGISSIIGSNKVFAEALNQFAAKYSTNSNVVEYVFNSSVDLNVSIDSNFAISFEADELLKSLTEKNVELSSFIQTDETKQVFTQVALAMNPELSTGYIEEAFAAIKGDNRTSIGSTSIYEITGLVGTHSTIKSGVIKSNLESFIARCQYIRDTHSTEFDSFVQIRQTVAKEWNRKLNLDDFKAKPLSNFVRNKLIKDCYLPLIGDSLAQQMSSIGSATSAQSGGLLLLSPPGYGKTTLLEYVAKIMGLVFVKIDCPAIGHEVKSIVPEEADTSSAKSELLKLNMALEMGNNVLLYLDDIQHLNTEFLQKFISLCDGTRRIEGSWEGASKSYDMKGKRFAIAMAGNPYTEQGEKFKVPDMLVNRMSSYNLGDVRSGMEEAFKLSYIENALTSNNVMAPLASRSQEDLYKLIRIAQGEEIGLSELEYSYSPAEATEITDTLKQMLAIQKIVLTVNAEYIRSAAMKHRKEPPFLMQGSYRNMAKMTEKLVPAMNEDDIFNLIIDHYRAESQTLTTGAEENMLRFKEINGFITDEESVRLDEIRASFTSNVVDDDLSHDDKLVLALQNIATALMK
ncbi:DNA repair ATPase [Vibrio sp. D431a]|uniref:DNA repair ATPase n=1 Tax=Vibrio sp. D431a TaxID=2837388 RepID=UPI0025552CC2|nr:DNA repair ATPase [Vibrio sp. D431a]MDK9793276.1 DNA repair ATPase [Vibrio sp. D431a]